MVVAIRQEQDTPEASLGCDTVDSRLEAYWPLIRSAAWRWADHGRCDHEDLIQEAALAVWRVLREKPDAPRSYIWKVASHAARDSLIRGSSIDRPIVGGTPKGARRRNPWTFVRMEALQEDRVRWQAFEGTLARLHRGELPRPTEERAVVGIMYEELCHNLTPLQRTVFELRLQGYTQSEISRRLERRQVRVHYIIAAIQRRAQCVWAEPDPSTCVVCGVPITQTPHVSRERIYCSDACNCRAYRERKKREASKGILKGPGVAPPGPSHFGQGRG